MNKYQQQAYRIIEQAEEAAERKYQKAVTVILPRQLAKTPKDEHRDEIRRRIHKLKDWQTKSFILSLDVEGQSREQLAAWLAAHLWDAAEGFTPPWGQDEQHAISMLSERLYISRYILHLVELLDGPAQAKGFEWIGQTITEAAQRFPDVQPWQIADETKTLTEIAEAYFDDLASGAVTAQDIAADIQKYIDKAKQAILNYPVKINTWGKGRNGRFGLECQALVLPKLKALFEPTQPPAAQAKPAPPAEAFGEALAQMIREALEARGQLKEGKFTGNSTQVKALYNVLAAGGYLKGTYREKRFAAFFLEHFAFSITDRTLQNAPNRGQDREEREYRQLLP